MSSALLVTRSGLFYFGLAIAAAAVSPSPSHADYTRSISHARLRVSDLVIANEEIGSVDLGPAPPPGGTRLVAKAEIEGHIRAAGFDPSKLKLPPSVRVSGASMRFTPEALAHAATPVIEKLLPTGVILTRVEPSNDVITRPGTTVKTANVPRLPRQKGEAHSTVVLELVSEDGLVTKIPVAIVVDISDAAARADVPRGGHLEVFYERGAIKIATTGVTLADADVGETAQVSLVATGRIVRAKILGRDRAEIVETK